jgi:PAS domain S-box-containing protein
LEQKESEDRIKAIVMNAPIGIAVSNADKQFQSANNAFCEILGYSESELQKMTFKDITHVDDMKESIQKMEDLDNGKISFFSQEKRYIKKDKTEIIGKVIVNAMRNQDGKPYLYIAKLEDVTERKQKDEALKKSEEKFFKAFKSSPVAICITRMSDGKFIEVNESLVRLSGYTRAELLTGSTIGLDLWTNSEDRKQVVEQLTKTGSVFDREYRFRIKNGDEIFVRYSGELIDFSGEICVLSAIVDTTERKKMEESLRESEERYRSLVENTQDVIMVTNPDGCVSYLSPACSHVLGYTPNDLLGTILPKIFHPEDLEKVNTALSNALKGFSGSDIEYRILTKTGELRWILHSWSPIFTEDHKIKFIVSIMKNITESKIAEQNLKAKIEELEKYKNVTVNREIKMVELKNEVNELCKQLNQKPKYPNI